MSGWIVLPAALILLPVVLISVPLTFQARGSLGQDSRRLKSKIAWGWGLFTADVSVDGRENSLRLRLAGISLPATQKKSGPAAAGSDKQAGRERKKSKKQTGRSKKNSLNFTFVFAVLNRQMVAAVLDFLKKLFKSLGLRLQVKGVYGADDPSVTGVLTGIIAALHAEKFNIDLDADFSGPVIDIAGETSGRLVPVVILWHSIRFLLSKPVRKLWWAVLKTKFRRKKIKESVQYV